MYVASKGCVKHDYWGGFLVNAAEIHLEKSNYSEPKDSRNR